MAEKKEGRVLKSTKCVVFVGFFSVKKNQKYAIVVVVQMRFTKFGFFLCFGGSLYCCIGLCCLFLLRQRHCPICYKKDFEKIARVRRQIQCLVDDKSELQMFCKSQLKNEASCTSKILPNLQLVEVVMTVRIILDFFTHLLIYRKNICMQRFTMPF
uniref:Transmembrane protein n=1 Tax=Wuchereria bancrofti TaxID=6293 RepID=A0A1I8EV93_WUCBA